MPLTSFFKPQYQNTGFTSAAKKPTTSITPASPSSVAPTLTTPAAKTYIQNQAPIQPVNNSSQINDIKGQIGDLQNQQKGLVDNNFTDTNQLEKGADGQYGPSPYENAKADYTKAYENYIQTLNPSREVSEAETAYNDYIAKQKTSVSNLAGQGRGIPLSLVRGQQEKLLGQTQPEAERLQNAIGIAENRDINLRNAGLAGVSLAEKKLGFQQSPADKAKAEMEGLKSNADLAKTKAETEKAARETEMIGKMTDYQKAQLAQDESQFGRTYALAKLKANQENTATTVAPEKALDQINLLKSSLAKAKELAGSSGNVGILGKAGRFFSGTDSYTNLVAETNTLRTNVLTLMTDPTIKKFFGPQMSNADVQLMTSAGTTLNPELQDPSHMKAELGRLENLINRAEKAVSQGLGSSANPQVEYQGKLYNVDANGDMTPAN